MKNNITAALRRLWHIENDFWIYNIISVIMYIDEKKKVKKLYKYEKTKNFYNK